jgi:hypothetical protein
LKVFRDFMSDVAGFSSETYSVTLPPFPNGDPELPWGIDLDVEKLGLLNVATVLSAYPLESDDLTLIREEQGVWIYQNEKIRPRAWVQVTQALSDRTWRAVESIEWTPNRITIEAEGPGVLVLSEISYPGWQVTVDGTEDELHSADAVLRSVLLSSGKHEVEFQFRPWTVYAGIGTTLIALLLLIGIWIRK